MEKDMSIIPTVFQADDLIAREWEFDSRQGE